MPIAEPLSEAAAAFFNGGLTNGGPVRNDGENNKKKSREIERRRRRRKQTKNNKKPSADDAESEAAAADEYEDNKSEINESVEFEYIAEKVDVEETFLEEFRSVLEKFCFSNSNAVTEVDAKKDQLASDTAANKKGDSDEEEEEQDVRQEEGVSNKKKKLQRRMKIAELKKISSRPDVVEVWDATAGDPKLLVFLKSYRNTVPVPRHWCQKRKFLQEASSYIHGART